MDRRYRIKRKEEAVPAVVPHTIRVCVDVNTSTIIEMTLLPEQNWHDELSAKLFDYLMHPAAFGAEVQPG